MAISSKRIFQGDPVIWVVFFLLCMISLIEVFSAASSLSYETGDFMAPLFKQAIFLGIGTAVVWFFHTVPCRYFKIIPLLCYPVCVALLIITLFFGVSENGGSRWYSLFGIRFQPSELAKGVVVIAVALVLSYGQTAAGADRRAMKRVLYLSGLACALIFPENLSTAVLLFGTVFLMMFVGRVPFRQLGRLVGAFVAAGLLAVLLVKIVPESVLNNNSALHRLDTWVARISDFTDKEEKPLEAYLTARDSVLYEQSTRTGNVVVRDSLLKLCQQRADWEYLEEYKQEAHANIAIASSRGIGKMPGNSDQRDHLAQAFSDFIYAIIIEEMGIGGAVLVAFLYVILLFRAGRIASRCERNFPAFLTMGLAILLVAQAMMNLLVAVGLAPVTGQPLPLISRGGTSTLVNCVYFGMILSVSRYARKPKNEEAVAQLPAASSIDEAAFHSNEGMV